VALLRARAGALLEQSSREGGKLLYVSRRLARERAAAEPPSLRRALRDLGYEVVVAETLDLADQIRLFSSARGIAGLHGAGLANMIWAPPGCRILELFPTGAFNDCYARLALTCGHSYNYVLQESPGSENSQLRRLLQDS
jgi:capsular polysaccharide biosynthesis protein